MPLHLRINEGSLAGRSYELTSGFLTVGRSETCSVRFDPQRERIASKQHAFIEARSDGYYLTDNSSTNGTYVNGTRVLVRRLNSGDQIQFGANGSTASVQIIDDGSAPHVEVRSFHMPAYEAEPQNFQHSIANIRMRSMSVAKPEPRSAARYLGIGATIFAGIFLAVVVALLMFASVGIVPAVVATVIAFLPAAFYLVPLMWLDRYDPEPFWLLALAFGWGALVSVFVSFIVNTAFSAAVLVGTGSADFSNIAGAVISAPIIEEASKGMGLVLLLLFFRKYFDDILDGMVFGGVIALGFATVENVLYYGQGLVEAYRDYGVSSNALWSFLVLFALRGIASPFAHVTFTAMTGIGCGMARESHSKFARYAFPLLGYALAVFLHFIWNSMSIIAVVALSAFGIEGTCNNVGLGGENFGYCAFFAGYIVLQIPFFLIIVAFIYFVMRRQRRILTEMLALDIARGLISEELAGIATSATKSTRWVLSGLFNGKYKIRSQYLRAVGKLGLSYWHIQRATAAQGQTASFQQNPLLRDEILAIRDKV